jgi:hypothetical protein
MKQTERNIFPGRKDIYTVLYEAEDCDDIKSLGSSEAIAICRADEIGDHIILHLTPLPKGAIEGILKSLETYEELPEE